MKNKEGKMDW